MNTLDGPPSAQAVRRLLARCRSLILGGDWPVRLAGTGRVLVTPLGKSPGVLFSALVHLRPARLLVVTSRDAAALRAEALKQAGVSLVEERLCLLDDPFRDFQAGDRWARGEEGRRWLAAADEVVVNVTGGTTVMQFAVERIAEAAARLGVPVRRIALVDRRPPEAQRAEPYVLGDLLDLSAAQGGRDRSEE